MLLKYIFVDSFIIMQSIRILNFDVVSSLIYTVTNMWGQAEHVLVVSYHSGVNYFECDLLNICVALELKWVRAVGVIPDHFSLPQPTKLYT